MLNRVAEFGDPVNIREFLSFIVPITDADPTKWSAEERRCDGA